METFWWENGGKYSVEKLLEKNIFGGKKAAMPVYISRLLTWPTEAAMPVYMEEN